jgi:hypothetical protein
MKPWGGCFMAFRRVVQEAAEMAMEPVQNGTFTGAIRGFGRIEKAGLPWYNFDSRESNLSIRHFNNLKSIRRHRPELGWGRFFKVSFKA